MVRWGRRVGLQFAGAKFAAKLGCKLPAPVGCEEVHQIIGEGGEKGVAITIAQDDDDAPADSFRRRALGTDAPSATLRVVAAAPALLVLAARAENALDYYQYQLGEGR